MDFGMPRLGLRLRGGRVAFLNALHLALRHGARAGGCVSAVLLEDLLEVFAADFLLFWGKTYLELMMLYIARCVEE